MTGKGDLHCNTDFSIYFLKLGLFSNYPSKNQDISDFLSEVGIFSNYPSKNRDSAIFNQDLQESRFAPCSENLTWPTWLEKIVGIISGSGLREVNPPPPPLNTPSPCPCQLFFARALQSFHGIRPY